MPICGSNPRRRRRASHSAPRAVAPHRRDSSALCGLNCECCADDIRLPSGGFHGTLLRSPRAHALSIFTQCHTAHYHNSWARVREDVTGWLAEGVLKATEHACSSFCTGFDANWTEALRMRLAEAELGTETTPLRMVPSHNMQAHALTCRKSADGGGSLGQHFRALGGGNDTLAPPLADALASARAFEWVGITDLFEPSVCLLHYQANGSLPAACDCASPLSLGLPKFTHGLDQHEPESLPADLLAQLDDHTAVDAQLFAAALRLFLGRLRTVEERTGAALLACIDWERLWRKTSYIPGLWAGKGALAPAAA